MQMRFSTYRLFACMGVVLLAGLPGVAAADESDSCIKLSDDLAVAGCTRTIDSHQYTGRSLARVYARRGGAYRAQGDLTHAMADYNESMRIDPTYPSAYNNRGNAWYHSGKFDRAIADFNQAIQLDPKDTKAYYNRGMAWEKKRSLKEALADFRMHARLAPSDPEGLKALKRVSKELRAI
jgi:tetratricopeptide (TPR) repeat protein